jgi:hypothetical protein
MPYPFHTSYRILVNNAWEKDLFKRSCDTINGSRSVSAREWKPAGIAQFVPEFAFSGTCRLT